MYPRYLAGELDEVRVTTRALSPEWIATEYKNQRPDSTFVRTIDPEVPIATP